MVITAPEQFFFVSTTQVESKIIRSCIGDPLCYRTRSNRMVNLHRSHTDRYYRNVHLNKIKVIEKYHWVPAVNIWAIQSQWIEMLLRFMVYYIVSHRLLYSFVKIIIKNNGNFKLMIYTARKCFLFNESLKKSWSVGLLIF